LGGLVPNKAFAETLGLRLASSLTGVRVAGQAQGGIAEGVRISFDNLTVDAPEPMLFDLTGLASGMREPVDALLGRDVLAISRGRRTTFS
jgi:hypothetical protein